MEWLKIIERIIGHLAWPVAAFFIIRQFSDELRLFIKRIKNAKYNGVELDLSSEIEAIKTDAENAGVTISYPSSTFPTDSIQNIAAAPEWAFIKSWQEIENVLMHLYSSISNQEHRGSIILVISSLVSEGIIDQSMATLIDKLRTVRNKIVHSSESEVTRGEALEWLGIAKSVNDRLLTKLS